MSKSRCAELKSSQVRVLEIWDIFNNEFKVFLKNRTPVEPIYKKNLKNALYTLFNLVEGDWRNTFSREVEYVEYEGDVGRLVRRKVLVKLNIRKQLKTNAGELIKIGDTIHEDIEGGCIVEGFELGTDKILCYTEKSSIGGLRKKKKYQLLMN